MPRLPLGLRAVVLAAMAIAAAAALRFFVIEQPEYGWACQSPSPPWWCPLRLAGIEAVRLGLVGLAALAAGLLALWRESPSAALFALASGAAGLILYVPEPAAGGALLGALVIVRRSSTALRAEAAR